MTRAQGTLPALTGLALAACGSSAPGYGGLTGSAGATGTGAGGSTGAAGSGSPAACQVDILPITPASFDGLVAGPAVTMRVRGSVTGMVQSVFGWQWGLTLSDGTPLTVTPVGQDPSLVEFPMATNGTYTIAVTLTGMGISCGGLRTITAPMPGAKTASFRLHVTPPSTTLVPTQDITRQVIGGTPSAGNSLTLDPGIVASIGITHAGDGSALPSYVRLTEMSSGAVLETHTAMDGTGSLRVTQGTYGVLVVPDGDVAPFIMAPTDAAQLGTLALALDDGQVITGTVDDAGGTPLTGATVVLRNGDLVSTTGTSDATGAFQVRARAGTFGLTVVTPIAAGGFEAKLSGGLVVDGTTPRRRSPSSSRRARSSRARSRSAAMTCSTASRLRRESPSPFGTRRSSCPTSRRSRSARGRPCRLGAT